MAPTAKEQLSEVKNLLDLLVDRGIAVTRTSVIQQHMGRGRSRITWPRVGVEPPWDAPAETPATYRAWLEAGAYSARLRDGALLQISFDYEDDELVAHRLCFMPCPYDLLDDEIRDWDIFEAIELLSGSSADQVRVAGPVRFDFDQRVARPGHSASHLTLVSPQTRIPTVAPLSLGHFVRFIFRHFYPDEWTANAFLREWGMEYAKHTIEVDDTYEVHVGWTTRF